METTVCTQLPSLFSLITHDNMYVLTDGHSYANTFPTFAVHGALLILMRTIHPGVSSAADHEHNFLQKQAARSRKFGCEWVMASVISALESLLPP